MLQLMLFPDNLPRPQWVTPPWTALSPGWQDIDGRLPADHCARLIDRLVDELDLTSLRRAYAGTGSSAYPPELLLRLVLYEVDRGRLSPAEWARDCRRDDAVRWLLRGLEPSRSCLYQYRDQLEGHLDRCIGQVLRIAKAEGLITGQRASVDGTFEPSRASRHTLINERTLETRWQQLDRAVANDFASRATGGPTPKGSPPTVPAKSSLPSFVDDLCSLPRWIAKNPATRFLQRQRYYQARQHLGQRKQHLQETKTRRAKAKRRSPERIKVSPTGPEAPLGFDKTKVFCPLYDVQLVCDLDSRFVLGYGVFAAVTDANLLIPTLERTRDLSGAMPTTILNDYQYANLINLKYCSDHGVTMYSPLPDGSQEKRKQPQQIPKREFTWLPEEQTYRCPEGHLLVLKRHEARTRQETEKLIEYQYRCPAKYCRNCPRQALCTRTPQKGRIINRSEYDTLWDELRERMGQAESQTLYKLRKQTVERGFADVKEHRALRRFGSFDLKRARIQIGLLVLVRDGLELLKARSQRQGGTILPVEAR
jgi:transposase